MNIWIGLNVICYCLPGCEYGYMNMTSMRLYKYGNMIYIWFLSICSRNVNKAVVIIVTNVADFTFEELRSPLWFDGKATGLLCYRKTYGSYTVQNDLVYTAYERLICGSLYDRRCIPVLQVCWPAMVTDMPWNSRGNIWSINHNQWIRNDISLCICYYSLK